MMIKSDLRDLIFRKVGLSKAEAREMIEVIFEVMKDALKGGEKVQITGFGVFSLRRKKERIGRDPKTGKEIKIPSRRVLTFRPSRLLKQKIKA
jgi:integration host factor subunit alpha